MDDDKNLLQHRQLGELLKELLQKHSLSMRQLSKLTGIDTATISRIINGKRKPTLKHLQAFSDELDVSMNQLLQAAGFSTDNKEDDSEQERTDLNQYIEQIQKLFPGSAATDISVNEIDDKIASYRDFAQTEDGKNTILSSFEEKIRKIDSVGPFINHLREFYERFREGRGSARELTLIGGALLYFIIPVDVIPDYLFPIGYLDDAIALQIVMRALKKEGGSFSSE